MSAVKKSHKKQIALDFDGVLHSYTTPWTDAATISDPPTPGPMRFLINAIEDARFDVTVVSSRLSERTGYVAVVDWIGRELYREIGDKAAADHIWALIGFSEKRPPAFVTIDDRGLTLTGTWPSLDDLAAFKPWNKRPSLTKAGRTQPTVPATPDAETENKILDIFFRDDPIARLFTEEWNTFASESGCNAPPDFCTLDGAIGYRPHQWTARVARRIDEMIATEVEKRLQEAKGRAEIDDLIDRTAAAIERKRASAR